uniref:Cilia- and flagella-associated protein 43 n=1 Tax=Cynoglossus semilaevis TaxID=244447 RepID=A0A3P8WKK9_CYNSE
MTASGITGVFAFSEQKLSPSIFVHGFPDFQLKSELKGTAQLDYTSLALSDGGPYLGCCSSLPDHSITVWNWENAEPICTQAQAGRDVFSLLFNPTNWLQLCALGTTSITVWNIEKSTMCANHICFVNSDIQLPAMEGLSAEKQTPTPHRVSESLSYFGPEMPPSAIAGLKCDTAEGITKLFTRNRLTPTAICWTTTSELLVGCAEGFLLLIDPESLSLSVLFNPTCKETHSSISSTCACMCKHSYSTLFHTMLSLFLNSLFLFLLCNMYIFLFIMYIFLKVYFNFRVLFVTSLACCPAANYAAVGTASGQVLFVDLNNINDDICSRVNSVDQEGHYLFTGSSDSHIYIIDAKPSKGFSVIGYTEQRGEDKAEITVLGVSAVLKNAPRKLCNQNRDSVCFFFTTSANLTGPNFVDRHGCLTSDSLEASVYEVPHPLQCCVLGVSEVFAYCHMRKSLQCFQLAQVCCCSAVTNNNIINNNNNKH